MSDTEAKKPESTQQTPPPSVRVKNLPPIKLKDKNHRKYVEINFMKIFGFIPETVIIEKVQGENNTFRFHVVLTEAEIKKEDEKIAEMNKKAKEEMDKLEKLEVESKKNESKSEVSTK